MMKLSGDKKNSSEVLISPSAVLSHHKTATTDLVAMAYIYPGDIGTALKNVSTDQNKFKGYEQIGSRDQRKSFLARTILTQMFQHC